MITANSNLLLCQETVLKLLEDVNENKAAGLDNLSSTFLKDGKTVLAKPISYICSLSIKYSDDYLKKIQKQSLKTIDPYPYSF